MTKREDHKEVAYLREDVSRKLEQFKRDHPEINSKSRIIEMALDYFFAAHEDPPPDEESDLTRKSRLRLCVGNSLSSQKGGR